MALQLTALIKHTDMPLPEISLTWSERQRSRLAVMLPDGRAAAILLPRGTIMEDKDVLCEATADDLRPCVRVSAAKETLLRISAASSAELIRVVYHLANRHVSAMLSADAVWIEPDPVLADLAAHLGATVQTASAVFHPEKGAYHGSHAGHSHHHDGAHGHHHGDLDAEDLRMGNMGELLSQAAHRKAVQGQS